MKKNKNLSHYDYDYSSPYVIQSQNYGYSAYSKSRKNISLPFCVIFILIILLCGVAFYFLQTNRKEIDFYFVQIDEFSSYKDASNLSVEVQKKGGAGYIYFDDRYHVLANFYPNIADAEKVCENIKAEYANAKVYTLTKYQFKQTPTKNADENKMIIELIKKQEAVFDELYANILTFDKGEINEKQISIQIANLHSELKKDSENYLNFAKNNEKFAFSVKYPQNIITSLADCIEYAKGNELSYLKYELIKIVVNHGSFLDCF